MSSERFDLKNLQRKSFKRTLSNLLKRNFLKNSKSDKIFQGSLKINYTRSKKEEIFLKSENFLSSSDKNQARKEKIFSEWKEEILNWKKTLQKKNFPNLKNLLFFFKRKIFKSLRLFWFCLFFLLEKNMKP